MRPQVHAWQIHRPLHYCNDKPTEHTAPSPGCPQVQLAEPVGGLMWVGDSILLEVPGGYKLVQSGSKVGLGGAGWVQGGGGKWAAQAGKFDCGCMRGPCGRHRGCVHDPWFHENLPTFW